MMLPVYVINLDWSRDRWERAAGQLAGLDIPYTRVPAVDGAGIGRDELEFHARKKGLLHWWIRDSSSAEIGCCLSHRKAWQRIEASGRPGGFVFEDDFVARADLPVVMAAIGKLQVEAPALIKLYLPDPSDPWHHETGRLLSAPLTGEHQLTLPVYAHWGTVAYYVNRAGAARLTRSLARCNRPVDDVVRRPWETGVTVLHVTPSPVAHLDGPSIIGPSRRRARQGTDTGLYLKVFRAEFAMRTMMHTPVRLFRARRIFSEMTNERAT